VTHVLLQRDVEVMRAYRVQGTPDAVLVRPDGTIGSPLALQGAEAIRQLVAHALQPSAPVVPVGANGRAHGATRAPTTPAAPWIGDPAPPLTLPDLSGAPVDLTAFQGLAAAGRRPRHGLGFLMHKKPHLRLVVPAADSDDAVLAEALDNPAIVRALITLSTTNERAMKAVRYALAFHVHRWYRLMHPDEPPPEDLQEDLLACLQEALSTPARPDRRP
jgi:hypothetical protein